MIDKQKNSKSIEDKIVHSSKLMIDKKKITKSIEDKNVHNSKNDD